MQDVTSFVNASSPLSVALSGGESKKGGSEKATTKSFISIMLDQLSEASLAPKTGIKASKESALTASKEEPKDSKSAKQEAKSIDEHLLNDLLKIVDILKGNTQAVTFPTLKSTARLEKVLNSEVALKELSEIKSLDDVMKLSKKYDLGLEKLSFSKESIEKIQKEFPTLAKTNFFETLQTESEEPQTQKQAKAQTPTTTSISPMDKQTIKNETNTPPPSALQSLMSKKHSEEPKSTTVDTKETINTKIAVDTKETVATNNKIDIKETIVLNDKQLVKEIKTIEKTSLETRKTTPTQTEVVTQKVITQTTDDIKPDKKIKNEPTQALNIKELETETETKSAPITRSIEPKMEVHAPEKGLTETILQTMKVEKPLSNTLSNETPIPAPTVNLDTDEIPQIEESELKQNTIEVKNVQKQEVTTKQALPTRESLNQFASDLREKIETYKPPVMKVELSLNPRNLGEVDVTLLTRGNNLHVNISSSTNTMTLFTQNQAEFKNALINMGFTNLEMNFSDQRHNEQQQKNEHKSNEESFEELTSEQSSNEITTIEVVIPRYV